MQILENRKERINFVKIIIGMGHTGFSGVKKPVKSIRIFGTTVEEVEQIIREAISKREKK